MVTLMLADTGVCWGEVFADLSLLFPLLWSIRSKEEAGAPRGFPGHLLPPPLILMENQSFLMGSLISRGFLNKIKIEILLCNS